VEAVDPEVQAVSPPRASGSAGGDAGAAVSEASAAKEVPKPSQPVDRDALFKLLSMGRGTVLEEYTVSDMLGKGAFARVYKAVKTGFAPVAMKIYKDRRGLEDAMEEGLAYARLNPTRISYR
jgi:serine/threonine-protein kinase RIO1